MIKNDNSFFVSGTDTGIGKTVVSAVLASKLKGIYWKPIQCGLDKKGRRDIDVIKEITKKKVRTFKELYFFNEPISPNLAAKNVNTKIDIKKICSPNLVLDCPIIIEGAGGLLVPINKNYFIIDLVKKISLPLILVTSTKLGTINHTLLSLEALKKRKIKLKGIVFVGQQKDDVINTIIESSKKIYGFLNKNINLGCLPIEKTVDFNTVKKFKDLMNETDPTIPRF